MLAEAEMQQLASGVLSLVALAETKRYDELATRSGGRLKASDIRRELEDYPYRFGQNAAASLGAMSIAERGAHQWLIDVPLWTEEEGISDQTLRILAVRSDDEIAVTLWDILVP